MKYEILQRKNLFKNKFFDIEQVPLQIELDILLRLCCGSQIFYHSKYFS